jgi:Na+-driven multidrug efflux pump
MGIMSQDPQVIALGAKVLRIEAFAETLYAASLVGYGIFVGASDTLVPSIMNLTSIWVVRVVLAVILTPKLGLTGCWIAMCVELNVRGALFLFRLKSGRWMKYVKGETQEVATEQ